MHPIVQLQGRLLAVLAADGALTALIGSDAVFDAPPKGRQPPYVVIARHDVAPRDGDGAPGFEHRLLLQAWHEDASRKAALAIAERMIAALTPAGLSGTGLRVTTVRQINTQTLIDERTGQARVGLAVSVFSEPVSS